MTHLPPGFRILTALLGLAALVFTLVQPAAALVVPGTPPHVSPASATDAHFAALPADAGALLVAPAPDGTDRNFRRDAPKPRPAALHSPSPLPGTRRGPVLAARRAHHSRRLAPITRRPLDGTLALRL
jgi:hypothetical protein